MLVSLNWLQKYFDQKLPEAERLADLLNFHAFEVEEIKAWDTDEILNVKILADRACYALSHRGIAGEISASGNVKRKAQNVKRVEEGNKKKQEIEIKKPGLCARYIGRRVEKVKVGKSPEWLVASLESIGERSINNIVDVANYVMFDIGQPLHAFDADKIVGKISVRLAKKGEKITTLDNRDVALDSETLLIADEEAPLAIAGIKGGKRAEVTEETTNLLLESANFNASNIRQTSTRLNIKTSASKRFESSLTPELAGEAMDAFSYHISQVSKNAQFGVCNDIYKKKQKPTVLNITTDKIRETLGSSIEDDDIIASLQKLDLKVQINNDKLSVECPLVRNDLKNPEDIVEEVGRIYGYDKIFASVLPPIQGHAIVNKIYFYKEKIKDLLVERGFSEVMTSSFTSKGAIEVKKALAEDKRFLRENLSWGVLQSADKNIKNASLLGIDEVRIFEVGSVFGQNGERVHLCIFSSALKKKVPQSGDIISEIISALSSSLELPMNAKISKGPEGTIAELDITDVFTTSRSPSHYSELNFGKASLSKFKEFSIYPFVLRDIAVFTVDGTKEADVLEIIKREAGELLQRATLFDRFEKKMPDGKVKISYAFHLVLQSFKKTLIESEVNEIMERMTKVMNGKEGWQVR